MYFGSKPFFNRHKQKCCETTGQGIAGDVGVFMDMEKDAMYDELISNQSNVFKRVLGMIESTKEEVSRADGEGRMKEQKFPMFGKNEEFRTFKRRVELWNTGSGLLGAQKIVEFEKAFEDRPDEESNFIRNRILMDDKFNKVATDVMKRYLETFEGFFEKNILERTAEGLRKLDKLRRNDEEDIKSYTMRFDSAVIEIQSCKNGGAYMLHDRILAIKLLDSSGLTQLEKSNVLVSVDQTDDKLIYNNMKEAMRKTKGVLAMESKKTTSSTFVGEGYRHYEDRRKYGGYEYDGEGRKVYP